MVYRAHTLRWTPQIYQAVLNQVQRWKRAGNPVVGIQIDFDARTRYLDSTSISSATCAGACPANTA